MDCENNNADRRDLFEPGKYLSLPDVLLRRTDLSASAKLVWMALAAHLGPQGCEVWPSLSRIAAMTGLCRDTVIVSVATLEDAGLVVITKKQMGKSNVYRIMQPQIGESNQSEKSTGGKNLPVGNSDGYRSEKPTATSRKNPPPPVGKTDATGRKNRLEPVGNFDLNQSEIPTRSTVVKYCSEVLEGSTSLSSSDDDFEKFWSAYPRKVGKGAARRAWKLSDGKRPALEKILAAIDRASQSRQWTDRGGQFIPHPATWLNQERWSDDLSGVAAKADYSRGFFGDGRKTAAKSAETEVKHAAGF